MLPEPDESPPPGLPIESRILALRGQRVLLDSDLAELYRVPTKALNQAVKRNQSRFPPDFAFQLISPRLPFAFTEQGVATLSSVLRAASMEGAPAECRLDMRFRGAHVFHMSRMVQIRNVPDDLHKKLKARAALEGLSLSDYLLYELRRVALRPTMAELFERIRSHSAVRTKLSPADAIRAERDSR